MVLPRDNRPARQPRSRSASVRSILALAGGAAAVPLAGSTADAEIIVDSSLRGTVIGWNTGAGQTRSVTTSSLPGGGFTINTRATVNGGYSTSFFFGVVAEWAGAGGGVFRRTRTAGTNQAYLGAAGATVSGGTGAAPFANINLATAAGYNSGNGAFSGSSKYLLFNFDNAGTRNYGWFEITATTTGVTGEGPYVSGYSATLGDWAYDNSGAQIAAGVVPEPATAALAMGGALVAGAAGLRRWRKQRAAVVAPAGEQA